MSSKEKIQGMKFKSIFKIQPHLLNGHWYLLSRHNLLGKWLFKNCCCSVTKPCLTLCDPMNYSRPVSPVLYYLPEFAQIHVGWFSDANLTISSSAAPFSFCLQSLMSASESFQWVGFSHQVAKVLEFQHQSFQWILRTDFLWGWLVWSLGSPRDSQESSPTPQFKNINSLHSAFFIVQPSQPYMTTGKI